MGEEMNTSASGNSEGSESPGKHSAKDLPILINQYSDFRTAAVIK